MRIFNTVIHLTLAMKDLIRQYAAYDLWANTRIVERLQRENENLLDRHVKSSFPSLRLSIVHIRDASNAWYGRIFDMPPLELQKGVDALLKMSVAMNDKVQAMDDEQLHQTVKYANTKGERFMQPRWQLLTHCFNHASYHRGQVITIMRQLDLEDIPNTDLVGYQRLLLVKR